MKGLQLLSQALVLAGTGKFNITTGHSTATNSQDYSLERRSWPDRGQGAKHRILVLHHIDDRHEGWLHLGLCASARLYDHGRDGVPRICCRTN